MSLKVGIGPFKQMVQIIATVLCKGIICRSQMGGAGECSHRHWIKKAGQIAGPIMDRKTFSVCLFVCLVLLAGCSTGEDTFVPSGYPVQVIKPVDVSGTDVQLPISSISFTSTDDFTPLCKEKLKASPDYRISALTDCLTAFQEELEKALITAGFTFSDNQSRVCIRLKVSDFGLRTLGTIQSGIVIVQSSDLAWVQFQIEYLDVKGQTVGVVNQLSEVYDSDLQFFYKSAPGVAEFTRKVFGDSRADTEDDTQGYWTKFWRRYYQEHYPENMVRPY